MPSSTLWRLRRDDLIAALGKMSRANGFYHNYGEILKGRLATRTGTSGDVEKPAIGLFWVPPETADRIAGQEMSATRTRGYHGFMVSVYVVARDGDHDAKADEVIKDIEKATITTDATLGLDRTRGSSGRDFTYLQVVEWDPDVIEGGGGTVSAMVRIRMDHITGTATSQG